MKKAKHFQSGAVSKCVLFLCGILPVTGALGQSSGAGTEAVPCMVNSLRVRIATGDDDLRGWDGYSSSKDNLDVTIHFPDNTSQLASDVNNNKEWKNKTVHVVDIKLNRAVPVNDIKGITLRHTGSDFGISPIASAPVPGAGIETADNWDMDYVEVAAEGGGAGVRIAAHGAMRFTAQNRVLNLRTEIPANSCGVADGIGRLNPSIRNLQAPNAKPSKNGTQRVAPSTIQLSLQSGGARFENNRLIQQALAHTVQIGPRESIPESAESYTAIIAILKRQSAAAHSLLVPAVRPVSASNSGPLLSGGTSQMLNPQPSPPKASTPQVAAGQTMSASGVQTTNGSSASQSNMQSGPSAHRPPSPQRQRITGAMAPLPTQLCKAGIATVDGGASGVWFSPVPGQDGRFVIQGCGFGTAAGQVYLSGVQFDPAYARVIVQRVGVSTSPDRVYFQVPANEWSDRQIVAQIDANASGLYDTNNVTLNVTTASGNTYQAAGMNFLAARADQPLQTLLRTPRPSGGNSCYGLTLSQCLIPGVNPAIVNSGVGALQPQIESPTQYWLTPGRSIAVVRGVIYMSPSDTYPLTFPSGTDTYQFNLAPGFELDPNTGVQLNHATIDTSQCQSLGGVYSNSGNWSVSSTSPSSFQVHWEEEACSPASAAKNPQGIGTVSGYAGFSAYELEITVLGPRAANPWASGNLNPVTIQQGINHPLLLGH